MNSVSSVPKPSQADVGLPWSKINPDYDSINQEEARFPLAL